MDRLFEGSRQDNPVAGFAKQVQRTPDGAGQRFTVACIVHGDGSLPYYDQRLQRDATVNASIAARFIQTGELVCQDCIARQANSNPGKVQPLR